MIYYYLYDGSNNISNKYIYLIGEIGGMRIAKKNISSTEIVTENINGMKKMSIVYVEDTIKRLEDIFDKVLVIDSVGKKEIRVENGTLNVTERDCSRDCPLCNDKTGCICKDAVSVDKTRTRIMTSNKQSYFVMSRPIIVSNAIYNIVMIKVLDTEFSFGATNIEKSVQTIVSISSSLVVDQLTRIYNRKFLDDNSGFWIERAKKTGEEMCLCSIDIDNFKRFNDSYGHDFGDKVLTTLASCMEQAIEGMEDTYPIRVGGDEFLVICTNGMNKKRFISVMSKLCTIVRGTELDFNGEKVGITISAGVGSVLEDNNNVYKELYDCADKALYRAKEAGKNCVR